VTKDRGHYVVNARRSRRTILQSGSGRKADDSSCTRAVSKVINDQRAARRMVILVLLLTSLDAQFTASDPLPFEKVCDEMNTIMRWIWSGFFFPVLSALVDILARAAARRIASRHNRTRMHLAKTFYVCYCRIWEQSTGQSRSLGSRVIVLLNLGLRKDAT